VLGWIVKPLLALLVLLLVLYWLLGWVAVEDSRLTGPHEAAQKF
jgi:hypothetical protein